MVVRLQKIESKLRVYSSTFKLRVFVSRTIAIELYLNSILVYIFQLVTAMLNPSLILFKPI